MILTRGLVLAALVALVSMPESEAAAPAQQAKKGHEKIFTGVVTEVKHAKGKDHGAITVRGHDHAHKAGKGKAVKSGSGEAQTVTFHVGPKTLFIAVNHAGQGKGKAKAGTQSGKGGVHLVHLHNIHEGATVSVHHHAHHAEEVKVTGTIGGGKVKGQAKK